MAEVRFRLTPLTPIHIGTGESLEPFEYVVDGDTLYRFKLDSFMLQLPPEAQARFVEAVEQSVPETRRFVSEQGAVAKVVARFTASVSPAALELYEGRLAGEAHPEVLACIRTGDRAYLPGSSLKGALRTALLYQAMSKDNRERNARKLEQNVFRFRTVQQDPFRAFKVGDGGALDILTRVHAVKVQVRRDWGWSEKLSLLVETVPGALSDGTEAASVHAVTIDAQFYRYHQRAFPLSAGAVLAACRDFYGTHLVTEQQATRDLPGAAAAYEALVAHAENLPDHACLVRLAWGSGRDATTVGYGLRDSTRPRSRRLTEGGFPLGWAELAIHDAEGAPMALEAEAPSVSAPPEQRPETARPSSLAELQVGMVLEGTVRGIVDYGVFVDVSIGRDGLVHRSKMGRGWPDFGDRVRVEVISVELERNRFGLRLVEILR
jgi:CRISPR type III-A-associated RAMP protein Csm5